MTRDKSVNDGKVQSGPKMPTNMSSRLTYLHVELKLENMLQNKDTITKQVSHFDLL